MEDSDLFKQNYAKLMIALLNGPKNMSELQKSIKNYMTLSKTILELENRGFVKTYEVVEGRKVKYVELTDRGKIVAEALKKAQWVANLPPEKVERFAQMKAFIHINTYEDHVTFQEVQLGESRIINVYVRPRGKIIYFYCEYHDSDDCEHVEVMFADPDISDYIREWINKNGYKLAKKYQKYVEKYW